jgi:hypothetical protein
VELDEDDGEVMNERRGEDTNREGTRSNFKKLQPLTFPSSQPN